MEDVVVVAYPQPIRLEARRIAQDATPDGAIGMGYYFVGRLIARGAVPPEAVDAITALLESPVSVALAAEADDSGNIDARICVVLPVDPKELLRRRREDEPEEAWRASIPVAPDFGSDGDDWQGGTAEDEDPSPRLALFPIGNAVRNARDRAHPDDVAADAREMLENLLSGRARDAVARAIDDLLRSL